MIPTSILRVWFFGLFSFVLIGIGIYCSHEWYRRSWGWDFEYQRSYFYPHWGFNHPTLFLAVAVGLLLWALFGGLIIRALFGLLTKAKGSVGVNAPAGPSAEEGIVSRLGRPDGSELHVECYGPEGAPVIVLTHGWGSRPYRMGLPSTRLSRSVSSYRLGLTRSGSLNATHQP